MVLLIFCQLFWGKTKQIRITSFPAKIAHRYAGYVAYVFLTVTVASDSFLKAWLGGTNISSKTYLSGTSVTKFLK